VFVGKIYIHLIWTTNDHKKSLVNCKKQLGDYLMKYGESKDINIRIISVLADHVHCIIRLNSIQSISDIVQVLKGTSSQWLNKNVQLPYRFKWDDEYFAFSIGYSQLEEFKDYISAQPTYHQTKSLQEEIRAIQKKYHLKYLFET